MANEMRTATGNRLRIEQGTYCNEGCSIGSQVDDNSSSTANADGGKSSLKTSSSGKSVSSAKTSIPVKKQFIPEKKTDKRVFLNVSPLPYASTSKKEPENIIDRLSYVLGKNVENINNSNFYGYLYNCLQGTVGLVFPYTPQITFGHNVNYETTDILHSNISVNNYKNTPPPTIQIQATFTADTREMAKHMLAAIWFLRAATKCDFGEQSVSLDNSNQGTAGVPPPILYLNGWNNLIDNVPVVVSSFNYTLPQDKDYVHLGLNLSTRDFEYRTSFDSLQSLKTTYKDGLTFVNGQPINSSELSAENSLSSSTLGYNRNDDFYLSEWLPTELTISITLKVQYNLLKYKKVFDLNKYKMGILYLDSQKTGSDVYTIDNNGNCKRVFLIDETAPIEKYSKVVKFDNLGFTYEKQEGQSDAEYEAVVNQLVKENVSYERQEGQSDAEYEAVVNQLVKEKELSRYKIYWKPEYKKTEVSLVNGYAFDVGSGYKFDKSGWTW